MIKILYRYVYLLTKHKITCRNYLFWIYMRKRKKTIYANIFATKIIYNAKNQKRLTLIKHNFLFGIGNKENGGKFANWTDQISIGSSDFGRATNGVAVKPQFHYASKKLVTSWTSWLHNSNKIASLEVSVGRWRPFGSTVQRRYVLF